jgi:dCTP deaminase
VILSQRELRKEVAAGRIKFDPPLEDNQWGEASIDLRLGTHFTKLQEMPGVKLSLHQGIPQVKGLWKTMDKPLQDEFQKAFSYCLEPEEFILALTHESITVPPHLIARVEGRSTYARLGISMHQTAPWIQPGWEGRIVLEIKNSGTVKVELSPLLDRPCQITFFKLTSAVPKKLVYGSKSTDRYVRQAHPLDQSKQRSGGKDAVSGVAAEARLPKKKKAKRARPK